jgi:mono/diheme cytochrome c family protein
MKQKFFLGLSAIIGFLSVSCSNSPKSGENTVNRPAENKDTPVADTKISDTAALAKGLNSKGIGRFKEIKLTHPLDKGMIKSGLDIYSSKCIACHKTTDEKLVGPGWKGITDRRTPEWIMNFITNTQVMLDKDLVAQSEMVTCVIRMPNQDLTDAQARDMLEYMRNLDGKK